MANSEDDKTSQDYYFKQIESGAWKNMVVFGVSEKEKGFMVRDPVKDPGSLCAGSMGSGKSIGMRHSVYTHVATNSENTIYLLIDAAKNMTDYKHIFDLKKNVAVALSAPEKMIPVVDMVYAECMARKKLFSDVGAEHIYAYEDKTGEKLARIFIVIEEFHAIPNHPSINFAMNSYKDGSAAWQLKQLMRIGRSLGVNFMLATQRGGPSDIPSDLKPGIKNMFAFKMTNSGDAAGLNLPLAVDIPTGRPGRCAYEDGWMQYPYMDDKDCEKFIKKYYKPLKAKLLKYQMSDYQTALSGETNEGMIWVKPLMDILENIAQFKQIDIAIRFLKYFGFEVEKQENTALVAHLTAKRGEDKYAVLIIEKRNDGNKKAVETLEKSLEILGCNKVMAISFGMITGDIKTLVDKTGGLIAEEDDFKMAANLIDNRESKELKEGKFESLISSFPLAENYVKEEKKRGSESDSMEEGLLARKRRMMRGDD